MSSWVLSIIINQIYLKVGNLVKEPSSSIFSFQFTGRSSASIFLATYHLVCCSGEALPAPQGNPSSMAIPFWSISNILEAIIFTCVSVVLIFWSCTYITWHWVFRACIGLKKLRCPKGHSSINKH